MNATICIPARLDSQRLPNKLLLDATGHPLIWHTVMAAKQSALADNIVVVGDSKEVLEPVVGLCSVMLIDEPCWCGTQRVAAAIGKRPYMFADTVVNLQADEPLLDGADLDVLIKQTQSKSIESIATLTAPLSPECENDANAVKAAMSCGRCFWFSRTALAGASHHIGVYGFHKITLQLVGSLPQSPLSRAERLEQLTWIENGWKIYAAEIEAAPLAINTRIDYLRFVESQRETASAAS